MKNLQGQELWGSDLRVLELVAEGLDKEEIAARLGLSEHTIIRHFYRIKKATGTGNRIKWLLHFGTWQIREDAAEIDALIVTPPAPPPLIKRPKPPAKPVQPRPKPIRAERPKPPPKPVQPLPAPAKPPPPLRCVACKKACKVLETEVVGGVFAFNMCKECRARLEDVRQEAEARKQVQAEREAKGGKVRRFPDLVSALAKASGGGN